MVDDYNQTVYQTSTGNKYTSKAHDSVIGAMSEELKRENNDANSSCSFEEQQTIG